MARNDGLARACTARALWKALRLFVTLRALTQLLIGLISWHCPELWHSPWTASPLTGRGAPAHPPQEPALRGQVCATWRLRGRRRDGRGGRRRELKEETSIKAGRLELIGVYSDPGRDPRGHTCSVAFLTRIAREAAGWRRRCASRMGEAL